MDYGFVVPLQKAAEILQYFNIPDYPYVGADGMEITYQNKPYWILERSFKMAPGTSNSPDGLHVVYSPSQEEVDMSNASEIDPDDLKDDSLQDFMGLADKILWIAGFGIGAYVLGQVLGFFKKSRG